MDLELEPSSIATGVSKVEFKHGVVHNHNVWPDNPESM